MSNVSPIETARPARPSRADAEAAVRTLLAWAGDDPSREGLVDTPRRVADAYQEYFSGYQQNPEQILGTTFDEVGGYDDIVLLRNMEFSSHCEHHIAPIIGRAHVAYLPAGRVVGISKLARVVDAFAHRLQSQETMTQQISDAINNALEPRGVAVVVESEHTCMTLRGVRKRGLDCVTRRMTGVFAKDPALEDQFYKAAGALSGQALLQTGPFPKLTAPQ